MNTDIKKALRKSIQSDTEIFFKEFDSKIKDRTIFKILQGNWNVVFFISSPRYLVPNIDPTTSTHYLFL